MQAAPNSARRRSLRPPTPQEIREGARREAAVQDYAQSATGGGGGAASRYTPERADSSPVSARRASLSKLQPLQKPRRRSSEPQPDTGIARSDSTRSEAGGEGGGSRGGRRAKSRPPNRQLPEPWKNGGGGGGGISRRPSIGRSPAPARPVPATPNKAKVNPFSKAANGGGASGTPTRPSSNPFSASKSIARTPLAKGQRSNPWATGGGGGESAAPTGSTAPSNPFSSRNKTARTNSVDDRVRQYEAAVAARGERARSRQSNASPVPLADSGVGAAGSAVTVEQAALGQAGRTIMQLATTDTSDAGAGSGAGAGSAAGNGGGERRQKRPSDEVGSADKQQTRVSGLGGRMHASTLSASLADSGKALLQSTLSKFPMFWRRGAMLGAGTFGKVYRGLNVLTGELFAVKQIPAQGPCGDLSQGLDHLAREVDLMKELRHENIVRYLGTEREDNTLYVFLEYVPGGSIASLLKEFGTLDEPLVAVYTRQILEGLVYLHEKHIIHRDVKGANILVNELGICKLADFGASRQLDGSQTRQLEASLKAIRGTVPFMAPEVIRQTGHGLPADIWSLGATVIEMASGSPPWSEFSTNLAMMFHVGTTEKVPTFPTNLSAVAHDFLDSCMKLDPKARLTARELLTHPFVKNASRDNVPSRYALAGLGRS